MGTSQGNDTHQHHCLSAGSGTRGGPPLPNYCSHDKVTALTEGAPHCGQPHFSHKNAGALIVPHRSGIWTLLCGSLKSPAASASRILRKSSPEKGKRAETECFISFRLAACFLFLGRASITISGPRIFAQSAHALLVIPTPTWPSGLFSREKTKQDRVTSLPL